MDTSFYAAAQAAITQQQKMSVISNNIANVNTAGFKSSEAVFQDLMYYNMRAPEGEQTNLTAGTGVKISHTNVDFTGGGLGTKTGEFGYAISEEGFFMLEDPTTGEITYTRNGNFYKSLREEGTFYLATDGGKLVLDENGQRITVDLETGELSSKLGVYDFANTDGMLAVGKNEFSPVPKNGEPQLVEGARVLEGFLELSNVDLATELANTIESSRAYSYVLKMIQTSDEVTQTVNSLRG